MAREFEPTPEMIPAEDFRFTPSVRVQQILKEPVKYVPTVVSARYRYGALDAVIQHWREWSFPRRVNTRSEKARIERMKKRDPEYRREHDEMSTLISRTEGIFVKGDHPIMDEKAFAESLFQTWVSLRERKSQELLLRQAQQPQALTEK